MTPKLATAASIEGSTPGPPDDLADRRGYRSGPASGPPGRDSLCDHLRSGRTVSARPHVTSERPAATSQGTVSVSAETSLPANSGPKTDRAEYRPEDRPEEDKRDASRPSRGRVHVAGSRPDQQRHGSGGPMRRIRRSRERRSQCAPAAVSRQPASRGRSRLRSRARARSGPSHVPPGMRRAQPPSGRSPGRRRSGP